MKGIPRSGRRRGFTLLEVVIALGLSLLLVAAVYSSLSLYWKYSVAGRVEAERAQLARAILRQIEIDLRSVVYHAATTGSASATASSSASTSDSSGSSGSSTAGKSGGTGTASTTTSSSSSSSGSSAGSSSGSSASSTSGSGTTGTTPDAALTSPASGLYGDAFTLLIHVSKPSRLETYGTMGSDQAAGSRLSDLQSVAYFVSGQGGGLLQGAATSPGLARMCGDRLLMQTADMQGNTGLMAANTKILAPEVTSITFYYFDGTTWLTAWDSGTLAALPKAVEIVLELADPGGTAPLTATAAKFSGANGGTGNFGGNAANSGGSHVYRLIVALPAGKLVIATQ